MNAVIGGWAAGYAMSLVFTFVLTWLAVAAGENAAYRRYLDIPPMLLAVPISIGTLFGWTMIGMLIGSAFELGGFADTAGALGAPSLVFLVGVMAVGFTPLPILLVLFPRHWWVWLVLSLSFVGLFGWLMPLMATR
jgi:hypothetical protein